MDTVYPPPPPTADWPAAIDVKPSHTSMHHCGHFPGVIRHLSGGNMFLCLRLRNIFLRLIASQALQSSMGVVLYVCAHGDGVDWFGCHPPTRLQPPPWPSCLCSISTSFNPSPSSCHLLLHAPPFHPLSNPKHSWICFRSHSFNRSYVSKPTSAPAFSSPLSFSLRSHSIVWSGFRLCSLTSL